jgi:hypothetical protein
MKAVLAVLCLAVVATAITPLKESEYQFLFTRFVSEHNKAYSTSEFFQRFNIFKNNVDYIRAENAKNMSYTLGMNQFGDLTAHEFKTQIVGGCFKGSAAYSTPTAPNGRAPTPVDWVAQGKVQKVKNQAQCGSCWAFAAIGALESAWAISKGGAVPDLSEQQLVDCAGSEGNQGCNGGLMNQAYDYLIKFGGSQPQNTYAYTGRDGSCKADIPKSRSPLPRTPSCPPTRTPWAMPLPRDPSPSPSRLTRRFSSSTPLVSWTATAAAISTTVSSLLASALTRALATGSSRTLGAPRGATRASSGSAL